VAPLAALAYPWTLAAFHGAVKAFEAGRHPDVAIVVAVVAMAFAFLAPIASLVTAMRLAATPDRTVAQARAKQVAFLSIAAPPLFVFLGVLLYMAGDPIPDKAAWTLFWAGTIVYVATASDASVGAPTSSAPRAGPALRVAHGSTAAAIVLLFLAMHIANHFMGLFGAEAHEAFMKVVRHVYRNRVVEPVLVLLLGWQVISGAILAQRYLAQPMDRFRAFQVASGAYLVFYVIGHTNSVFVYARHFLGIDTGWGFATGAPTGLLADAWNVRLVPHYALGVFFVLAHLFSGLRIVMLAHGVDKRVADRTMIGGSVGAALVAAAIILGMCGVRLPG
jgi:hypothetical protein